MIFAVPTDSKSFDLIRVYLTFNRFAMIHETSLGQSYISIFPQYLCNWSQVLLEGTCKRNLTKRLDIHFLNCQQYVIQVENENIMCWYVAIRKIIGRTNLMALCIVLAIIIHHSIIIKLGLRGTNINK